MKVALLGLAALHSKELGIIFMPTFVECYHMEWLSKDSRFDENGLLVMPERSNIFRKRKFFLAQNFHWLRIFKI